SRGVVFLKTVPAQADGENDPITGQLRTHIKTLQGIHFFQVGIALGILGGKFDGLSGVEEGGVTLHGANFLFGKGAESALCINRVIGQTLMANRQAFLGRAYGLASADKNLVSLDAATDAL